MIPKWLYTFASHNSQPLFYDHSINRLIAVMNKKIFFDTKNILALFKFAKWIFKTIFLIIGTILFKCNTDEKEKIRFNGKVVTDENFIVLNDQFAKDSTNAYYKSRSFSYADVPTFEALDDHYAKDKNKAYYCDEYREGQNYYLTKRQTILEVKNADPASFTSLKNGYAKDSKHAWFQAQYFEVKDVSSLVSINNQFAKDDVSAYLNLQPINRSDGKTFVVLDGNFAKDKSNIYYYGYTGEGQSNICILPCERQSFQILDYRYSRDNIHVFFLGFRLKDANPETFQILDEDYSKDKNNVYFQERKMTGADPETFEVFKENGMYGHDINYAKDRYFVFMDDKKMTDAEVSSFRVLGENYASDNRHVFYKAGIVKDADPGTYNVYPHDMGDADSEDNDNKYHEGTRVVKE